MDIQKEFDAIFEKSADFYFADGKNGPVAIKLIQQNVQYVATPSNTASICNNCFGNSEVKCVLLNSGLQSIGAKAFVNCASLKKVWIPKTVTEIEEDAFVGCVNVEIFCEGEPVEGWVDKEYDEQTYAPDPYNFHRGGGDDSYIIVIKHIVKNYNPLRRPLYTNVSAEDFLKRVQLG